MAWGVRIALFLAPFLTGWLAIRFVQPWFAEPDGLPKLLTWIAQAIVVSGVASFATSRALHRFTPLPALLTMTLVFPDHAPPRFSLALRSGTIRKLLDAEDLELSSDLQRAAEEAIILVDRLSRHERLTRGHTERVRAHADLIGQQLGLDEAELNRLRWGTLLHDVGKLKVPAELLSKKGAPTEEEWAILRRHPAEAVTMLTPFEPWLGEWTLAASEHHERWDGTGYPLGLAGTEISLAGRITAVADAYDVITSRRSYKDPISVEEARSELVASAGTHFDPRVVRAMLEAGLTKQQRNNPFGWLLEAPGLTRALDVGFATPVAALVAVALTISNPAPTELALIQTTTTAAVAETTSTSAPPTEVTSAPDESSSPLSSITTTRDSQSTGAPSTTPAPANLPTTTQPTTTSTVRTTNTTTAPTTTGPTTTAPPTACELATSGQRDLPNADLAGCDLSGLVIDGFNFNGADLRNADFSDVTVVNFTMTGANLVGATLSGASFTDGSFAGSTLTNVDASGMSLTRVSLENVSWNRASLADSSFREVSFIMSSFAFAVFDRATISLSQLQDASFVDASFANADFSMVGFDRSNLTRTNFGGAAFDSMTADDAIHQQTICPDGGVTNATCF